MECRTSKCDGFATQFQNNQFQCHLFGITDHNTKFKFNPSYQFFYIKSTSILVDGINLKNKNEGYWWVPTFHDLTSLSGPKWETVADYRCSLGTGNVGIKNVHGNISLCQDFCVTKQPDCVGYNLNPEGRCYLKASINQCGKETNYTVGMMVNKNNVAI